MKICFCRGQGPRTRTRTRRRGQGEAKDLTYEAKTKAEDLTNEAKAKAKDFKIVLEESSRPRPRLEDYNTGFLVIYLLEK